MDVFCSGPLSGNPLAVVVDSDGLDAVQMQEFARFVNLSETTFLGPGEAEADHYRVRIFTPTTELAFAGHPTLGSAAVWAHLGAEGNELVQHCGVGPVAVRREGTLMAFRAPPLNTVNEASEATRERLASGLGLEPHEFGAIVRTDNGIEWLTVELTDWRCLGAIAVDPRRLIDAGWPYLGLYAWAPGADGTTNELSVRSLFEVNGSYREDLVTGSLQAALAGMLHEAGAPEAAHGYVARQGQFIGGDGRVTVTFDVEGRAWIGGETRIVSEGWVTI